MSAVELITFGATSGGSAALWYVAGKVFDYNSRKRDQAAIDADTTDGRTSKEWFDLLKGMGKEEYEKLSRGALDGLEEHDTYGRWDIKVLLKNHYDTLMMEWYPEKYCKYCRRQGCKQTCDAYWAGMPPCKVCRKSLKDNTCDYCGYVNFKWEPHPRKEREWTSYSDRSAEYKIRSTRVDAPDIKTPAAVITTGSGDNMVRITDGGMTMITKHNIQIIERAYRDSGERGYKIVRGNETWIVGKQEIKDFQRSEGLAPTGDINYQTRVALIRYLDEGGSISGPRKRLTVSEAARVQKELDMWMNKYSQETTKTISRYDSEGNVHW